MFSGSAKFVNEGVPGKTVWLKDCTTDENSTALLAVTERKSPVCRAGNAPAVDLAATVVGLRAEEKAGRLDDAELALAVERLGNAPALERVARLASRLAAAPVAPDHRLSPAVVVPAPCVPVPCQFP